MQLPKEKELHLIRRSHQALEDVIAGRFDPDFVTRIASEALAEYATPSSRG